MPGAKVMTNVLKQKKGVLTADQVMKTINKVNHKPDFKQDLKDYFSSANKTSLSTIADRL